MWVRKNSNRHHAASFSKPYSWCKLPRTGAEGGGVAQRAGDPGFAFRAPTISPALPRPDTAVGGWFRVLESANALPFCDKLPQVQEWAVDLPWKTNTMGFSPSVAAPRLALPWIVRLRYGMAAGQFLTAWIVDRFLQIDLPLGWISLAPAVVILTNWWLARQKQPAREPALIGGLFVFDTLCLTAVLMLTGGPNNPFSLLYLVHITLSATILTRRQTWALGALSTACFGSLFLWYLPIDALEMHHHGEGPNLHLPGMWIAFGVAAFLVAMFSGKISELLREREESLLRMQEELARKDRLASLVTLAAGAAHELNTPLGTIAVVAKELERYATQRRDGSVADDSRLIRTEVDRCREILQRMSASGAEPSGEAIRSTRVAALIENVASAFRGLRTEIAPDADVTLQIPRYAVEQALTAVINNAFDASPDKSAVWLSVHRESNGIRFTVHDSGSGMSAETLRHVGEPFFTTKEPGKGMGLGIFLVQTLAERLGGRFTLESKLGEGTQASLSLPVSLPVAAAEVAR
jgi:two-component system sensor histidine kinase RegB